MPTTRSATAVAKAPVPAPSPPPKALAQRKAQGRKAPILQEQQHEARESLLISLPTECLVEVLRYLEIHELLEVAWTCRRFHDAAQDTALWGHTHFSVAEWRTTLQRHFIEDRQRRVTDHTGVWTRCVCRVTQVRSGMARPSARASTTTSPPIPRRG